MNAIVFNDMKFGVIMKRYVTKNSSMMLDMLLSLGIQDSDSVEANGVRLCTYLRPDKDAFSFDSVDSILAYYDHLELQR